MQFRSRTFAWILLGSCKWMDGKFHETEVMEQLPPRRSRSPVTRGRRQQRQAAAAAAAASGRLCDGCHTPLAAPPVQLNAAAL